MSTIRVFLFFLLSSATILAKDINEASSTFTFLRNMKQISRSSKQSFGIINGTVTDILHHPYQVAVLMKGDLLFSGVVLTKSFILTVAIPPYASKLLKVAVGHTQVSNIRKTYDLEKIFIHPKLTIGLKNNIGLLKLRKPLKFSKNVKPIKIATSAPLNGSSAVVTGWGKTDSKSKGGSDVLIQLKQTVITRDICRSYYFGPIVSDTSICAFKSKHTGPSYYDYGDPLVQNKKLIGLFAEPFSQVACLDSSQCPSIYTDVGTLSSWIFKTINKYE